LLEALLTISRGEWMGFPVKNRFFLGVDLIGWSAIPFVALWLRLDSGEAVRAYLPHLLVFLGIAVACKVVAVWSAGLYRRYWRYASVDELGLIVIAVVGAGAAATILYFAVAVPLVPWGGRLPWSVPILDGLLTLMQVGGTRFATRLSEHFKNKWRGAVVRDRALIVGAGGAGTMIARELRANPQHEMEPVGFIDDNPSKHGNTIYGLPVLGDRDELTAAAREYGVTKVIIAMPAAPGTVIREILDICEVAKLSAKTIPGVFDILSGRVSVKQLRDVQIDDLLRRKPVQTDQRAVSELVGGMVVLVTGAGGSIGGEICRQVAALGASELILLDHGENGVFEIHHELAPQHLGVRLVPAIADIRDPGRIRRIFERFRPQAIFHAAAHKHVPLMELNPEEAFTNNVLGTRNVLAAAEQTGVEHFVLISTDKAVNPANVMGATKLLAEMLVHDAAVRTGAPFVSVRFGNVLASCGSVVPLFQKQIAAGGPVTVTHPEMTRYFMTIPEAVQLVLQAAPLGRAGETFVLDMGKPVKIVALAKDLVHLSGLEVGRDIDIVFTGLRPGERLREELFSAGEDVDRTQHEKIFVVRNGKAPRVPDWRIDDLVAAVEVGDSCQLKQLLAELVPGYDPENGQGANTRPETDVRREPALMQAGQGQDRSS
jgi:FlaA1/EpsC-like NDP-sugar epimerase